jgi:regulatory protein
MKKKSATLSPKEAISRLMEICGKAEKSPFEVKKKLKEWGLEAESESILSILVKEKFVDPSRFAVSYVHDKLKFNKWGKLKIRYALNGHQIDPEIIEQALKQIDDEHYSAIIIEELEKKMKTLRETIPYRIKGKLYAFGNQRGYESEIINRFFEKKGY